MPFDAQASHCVELVRPRFHGYTRPGRMTMTRLDGIAEAADRLSDEIVALRRQIHEHPELAFEEHQTATRVEAFLKRLGIPCRTGIGKTGIVALLDGGKPGPTIAIRADMDALPINEPAGLPFASKVPGKMHACGHDAHTAIVARRRCDAAVDARRHRRPRDVRLPARRGDARPAQPRCSRPVHSPIPFPTRSSASTTGRSFAPGPWAGIPMR